ncbi:MAG: hypothetical protein ACFB00_07435 [Parvularculaceae bacterium]
MAILPQLGPAGAMLIGFLAADLALVAGYLAARASERASAVVRPGDDMETDRQP